MSSATLFLRLTTSSCAVLLASLPVVSAHGRLLTPMTRVGHKAYENNPVIGANRGEEFVCRHAAPNPSVQRATYQAGGMIDDLQYETSAPHVGDCAVYLSYDVNAARRDMTFFKIANIPDCKAYSRQNYAIKLPEWLPAGNAVLRWSWYALHVNPPEFYAQCADITIAQSGAAVDIAQIYPRFSMIDPPVYPDSRNGATSETGYRDPYGNGASQGQSGWFFTGPPCARGFTANNCELTKDNKNGVSALTPPSAPMVSSPPPPPSSPPAPAPPPLPPKAPGTLSPSPPSSSGQCAACLPTPAYAPYPGWYEWCASPLNGCPDPQCVCESSAQLPSPSPFPPPLQESPSPATSPSPPPSTSAIQPPSPPASDAAFDKLLSCVQSCVSGAIATPYEEDLPGRRLRADSYGDKDDFLTATCLALTALLSGFIGVVAGALLVGWTRQSKQSSAQAQMLPK